MVTTAGAAAGSAEYLSEAIKKLKLVMLKRVIEAYKMDQALIFVRTRLDADNVERFLMQSQGTLIDFTLSRTLSLGTHRDLRSTNQSNQPDSIGNAERIRVCLLAQRQEAAAQAEPSRLQGRQHSILDLH